MDRSDTLAWGLQPREDWGRLMKLIGLVMGGLTLAVWPLVLEARQGYDLPKTLIEMGHQYYDQYCSACHGADGRGQGPVAPVLRTPPADLTRIAQRRGGTFPEAEITQHIDGRIQVSAHGPREMPVWGRRFSDKFGGDAISEEFVRGHLMLLVEYLKSIQQ